MQADNHALPRAERLRPVLRDAGGSVIRKNLAYCGGGNLRVLVHRGPFGMGVELGDCLTELGLQAQIGAEDGWDEVDLVILPADAVVLGHEDLRRHIGPNTVVVLWQVDPLPPAGLTPAAIRLGRRIARCHWQRLLPNRMGGAIMKYVPLAGETVRLIRWTYTKRLKRELRAVGHSEYAGCAEREWGRVMAREYWLETFSRRSAIDHIFATTMTKQRYLEERGYPSEFVPMGYHKNYGELIEMDRDIDVLFLGSLNNRRRKRLLRGLALELEERGVRLTIVDRGCYGPERQRLLNRSKVSLDLPRVPWDFGPERFLMSMACGSLVVSEGQLASDPYKNGVHFVQAQAEHLARVIHDHVVDNEKREAITREAHAFVTQRLLLRDAVLRILAKSYPSAIPNERRTQPPAAGSGR